MGIESVKEAYEETDIDYAEDSLTADLAAAWGEADLGDDDDPSTESTEPDASAAEPAGEEHPPAAPGSDPVQPGAVQDTKTAAAGAEGEAEGSDKPPVGLSPAAREAWKDTPAPVRKEIAKREADFARGIQQYAENAKRAEGMDRMLQPFQQYLAMNGGPGRTIQTLLETGAHLQMGSPMQKAQMVAQLIGQFGVDIQTLDQLLVGKTPQPKQQDAVQQAVQRAIQPYQQQMEQFKAMQNQAAEQQRGAITQEVNDFAAKNEFYTDVRGDMADILDMAANRGQAMSMQQAYDKACMLHPEISSILQARNKAPTAGQRKAASSISGSPGGVNGPGDMSLRATIEDAWANAGRD